MNNEPLEPLAHELKKLLDAAPAKTLGPAKVALWTRLEASASAGAAAAVGGGVAAKLIGVAVAAAVAGAGGGIALDRFVLQPEPKVIERVVVKTVTVTSWLEGRSSETKKFASTGAISLSKPTPSLIDTAGGVVLSKKSIL